MLAKIAPRFVINGVIQNSYYANYMAVELAKQIVGQSNQEFHAKTPKHYFECNFFGYLATLPKPTEFTNQFESEKYDEAVQKFKVYNEVKEVSEHLNEFTLELRQLYRVIEANNSSSNFFARSLSSDETWEQDVADSLQRYHNLVQKLQPYPEWKEMVVSQIGKWFHVIHNNLADGQSKRLLFEQLNRQQYFI